MNPTESVNAEEFLNFYFSVAEKKFCAVLFDNARDVGVYSCLYSLIKCNASYERDIVIVSLSSAANMVVKSFFISACNALCIPHSQVGDCVKIKTNRVFFVTNCSFTADYKEATDLIFNDCIVDKVDMYKNFSSLKNFESKTNQVITMGRTDGDDQFPKIFKAYLDIQNCEGCREAIEDIIPVSGFENIQHYDFAAIEVKDANNRRI